MENKKIGKVFVCGDTHGSHDIQKLNTASFPEQKDLTKDDVLIQLGDFALYWNILQTKEEHYWLNWLASKRYTFAFLDGNHENHQMFWDLPLESKWGGLVNVDHRQAGDIYYLRRGEVYTINGKKIFVCGGAASIDKEYRTENVSWWATELLSSEDIDNALDNLDLHDRKVDYMLTHTCPDRLVPYFTENTMKFHDPVAQFLGHLDNIIEFKSWEFGHMHRDYTHIEESDDGTQKDIYRCHYNGVPYELP